MTTDGIWHLGALYGINGRSKWAGATDYAPARPVAAGVPEGAPPPIRPDRLLDHPPPDREPGRLRPGSAGQAPGGRQGPALQAHQGPGLHGWAGSRLSPLPKAFLAQLAKADTVLVTSRAGSQQGTVRTWFVVTPAGDVYLFTSAFSVKAVRWRSDPWVRLT